VRKQVRLK
jgi:hypothetical protein